MREYSVFNKKKTEIAYLRSLNGMFDHAQRLSIEESLRTDGQWENEFFIIRLISSRKDAP